MIDWLFDWQIDCPIDWHLIDCWFDWKIDELIDWLIDWYIDLLTDTWYLILEWSLSPYPQEPTIHPLAKDVLLLLGVYREATMSYAFAAHHRQLTDKVSVSRQWMRPLVSNRNVTGIK